MAIHIHTKGRLKQTHIPNLKDWVSRLEGGKMKCKYHQVCGDPDNCSRCPEMLKVIDKHIEALQRIRGRHVAAIAAATPKQIKMEEFGKWNMRTWSKN